KCLRSNRRYGFISGVLQLAIQRILVVREEQLPSDGLSEVAIFLLHQSGRTEYSFGAEVCEVILDLIPGRARVGVEEAGVANQVQRDIAQRDIFFHLGSPRNPPA